MTYLVTVKFANHEHEVYIKADSEQEALDLAIATLLPRERRWANVFIG